MPLKPFFFFLTRQPVAGALQISFPSANGSQLPQPLSVGKKIVLEIV